MLIQRAAELPLLLELRIFLLLILLAQQYTWFMKSGFFLDISDASSKTYMKSQAYSAAVSLPTSITDLSVNPSNKQVGHETNLYLYVNLVAALEPNAIYEINAQGWDLSNATVSNPNTVKISATVNKLKINTSSLVPPLILTGVINNVEYPQYRTRLNLLT